MEKIKRPQHNFSRNIDPVEFFLQIVTHLSLNSLKPFLCFKLRSMFATWFVIPMIAGQKFQNLHSKLSLFALIRLWRECADVASGVVMTPEHFEQKCDVTASEHFEQLNQRFLIAEQAPWSAGAQYATPRGNDVTWSLATERVWTVAFSKLGGKKLVFRCRGLEICYEDWSKKTVLGCSRTSE